MRDDEVRLEDFSAMGVSVLFQFPGFFKVKLCVSSEFLAVAKKNNSILPNICEYVNRIL